MTFSLQSLYDWYRQTIRNPKYRWWIILGTVAYLLMPFDIAPDFLPIIGQIDDALVVTLLFTELSQVLIERLKVKNGSNTATVGSNDSVSGNADVDVKAVEVE